MKIYNPLKNQRGESAIGILGAVVGAVIGFYTGGPWGAVKGAMWGYALGSGADMIVTGFPVSDTTSIDASATYSGPSPIDTIQEGIPIPRAYGRCQIAGNKIRMNDINTETNIKIILAHCMGEVSGVISYRVNDIAWASLTGTHSYNFYSGTTSQFYDIRFAGDTLGDELMPSPSFTASSGVTAWAPWSYDAVGDEYDIDGSQGGVATMQTNITTISPNNFYRIYATIGNYVAGNIRFRMDGGNASGWYSGDKIISVDLVSGTTTTSIIIEADTDYNGSLQYFSVKNSIGRNSAYRGIAYSAFTFSKENQIGWNPNITAVGDWLLCTPIGEVVSGGSDKVFSRNPAVVAYDWYINVEDYKYSEMDIGAFRGLEAYCNALDVESGTSRYTFDYVFDTDININDAKKLIWQSFNGACVQDQGKIKPVWESAKATIQFAFDTRNIIRGSFTWSKPKVPNTFRVHYIDGDSEWEKTFVELKNDEDIKIRGTILHEENRWFINNKNTAKKRVQFIKEKSEATDFTCRLSSFSNAGALEIFDRVTVTHPLPGWNAKDFIVKGKTEDQLGRPTFLLEAFYAGIYHGEPAVEQSNYASTLPNPFDPIQIERREKIIVGANHMEADYTTVSAAIEAVSATRSLIYVKNGTYDLERQIVLPNKNFEITGETKEGVIFKNLAGTTGFIGQSISNNIIQKFSNFTVSSQNQSSVSTPMMYFTGCSNSCIFDIDNINMYLTDNFAYQGQNAAMTGDIGIMGKNTGKIIVKNSFVTRGLSACSISESFMAEVRGNEFYGQNENPIFFNHNYITTCVDNSIKEFGGRAIMSIWSVGGNTIPIINIDRNNILHTIASVSRVNSYKTGILSEVTPSASVSINKNIISMSAVSAAYAHIMNTWVSTNDIANRYRNFSCSNNNTYLNMYPNVNPGVVAIGLALTGFNGGVITNNNITLAGVNMTALKGIYISWVTGALVANNNIICDDDNGGNIGIYLYSSAYNCTGGDNITRNTTTSIDDDGTNNTVTAHDYA